MTFSELDGNQRRHLINVKQAFVAWREARRALRRSGGMHWKTPLAGRHYLYRTICRAEKSVGVRSEETERMYADHQRRTADLQSKVEKITAKLDGWAAINRAMNLGRMPTIAARILRKLDDADLLDDALRVAGTNAIFAYEAGTGVICEDAVVATDDLDLLWDARRRMSLLLADVRETGVLGLLQQVDRSFERIRPFQAANADPYLVDLIRPIEQHELAASAPQLSAAAEDFDPAAIEGLQWLVNAPRYEEVAVGEDGLPVRIATVDPRAYALHKVWLSKRTNRAGLKRARDLAQARAVAEIAVKFMGLSFADNALTGLPRVLLEGVREFT